MRTRRTKYAFTLLIAVVAVLLALAWQMRDLPFTSRARLLSTNSKLWSDDGFLWLSNNQVAYRRYDPLQGEIRYSDFIRDFDAGTEKPVKELSRLSRRQNGALGSSVSSPNGHWRVTNQYLDDDVSISIMKNVLPFRVDHEVRPEHRGTSISAVSLTWWRNSEGWSLLWHNELRKRWFISNYRRDQAKPDSVLDISFLHKPRTANITLVGFSTVGNPIIARYDIQGWGSSTLADFVEIEDVAKRQVRITSFKHPEGTKGAEHEPVTSRSGERLLWLYRIARDDGWLPGWVTKAFPSVKRAQRTYEEFWVSAVDGTNIHRVGWRDISDKASGNNRQMNYGWMPDGKGIYYELNGNLYSFAAH